ncbi:MAG TPA: HAD-IB family hydrolase, partial [Terriglobales bacterium]|nr:HAD-IB family hydrolase [Terriglobales bacterium]
MPLHAELIEEIEVGPSGPHIGAFFDLDQTLIATFSMFEFFREGLRSGFMGLSDVGQAVATITQFQLGQISFARFVTRMTGVLKGRSEDELAEVGERIFHERLAAEVYPEARALVAAHRRKQHTVAIVSASTPYQAHPLAADFGIPHVLCTQLQVRNGKFTGRLVQPTCYGEGKAIHARRL